MKTNKHKYIFVSLLLALTTLSCAQKSDTNLSNKQTMDNSIHKTNDEWKEILSPEQYYILREKGTEKPFTGKLLMVEDKGVYRCSGCGNPLFSSDSKFDSHCGWPSFDREIKAGTIKTEVDSSFSMVRTEIMCAKCGGHLGHVFNDGPTKTGLRYCVNSVSMEFLPEKASVTSSYVDTVTFGGGCFWCTEAIFQRVNGVISVESGYSGGSKPHPTYQDVCSGTSNHAEVIQVVYDKREIKLLDLFEIFFAVHDPTTLNKQGNDVGTQYRSVIFYRNEDQLSNAQCAIKSISLSFDAPIVTKLEPFDAFYKAENYHQDYYKQNGNQPYCKLIIMPKLRKFEKMFQTKLKE